jgi:hypothetical protein
MALRVGHKRWLLEGEFWKGVTQASHQKALCFVFVFNHSGYSYLHGVTC